MLEILCLALSAIPLLKGVPEGVVYVGNSQKYSVPNPTRTGELYGAVTEQPFDDDGPCPVLHLQVVFLVGEMHM